MRRHLHIPYDSFHEFRIDIFRAIRDQKLIVPGISVIELIPEPVEVCLIDLEQVDGNTDIRGTSICLYENGNRLPI